MHILKACVVFGIEPPVLLSLAPSPCPTPPAQPQKRPKDSRLPAGEQFLQNHTHPNKFTNGDYSLWFSP